MSPPAQMPRERRDTGSCSLILASSKPAQFADLTNLCALTAFVALPLTTLCGQSDPPEGSKLIIRTGHEDLGCAEI
jgi:hypothetical protein